jgi:hypothetical protein
MNEDVLRDLEAELLRLGIAASQVDVDAVVGNPPWLYPPEYMLRIARTLPDRAGPVALGRALSSGLTSRPAQ